MKRLLLITLIFFSSAIAQEPIPFEDSNQLSLGPKLIVRPEITIHKAIVNQTSYFTVNLSNPGTVSFTQINFFTNHSFIQRSTGQISLRKKEAKTFNISVKTNTTGITMTKMLFTGYDTKTETSLMILSSSSENVPILVLGSNVVNTLESINAFIIVPSTSGTLYYGLANLEGEVIGVKTRGVSAGEEVSLSIPIPKEAVPGKYLFFTSLNQETYAGEIIEITTLISIQVLLVVGLLIVGIGALIQAGRLKRKERIDLTQ